MFNVNNNGNVNYQKSLIIRIIRHLQKASQGFVFLGYHFKVGKKKTIVKIRSETRKKIYKTIKRCYKNYEEDNFMYFYSVMNNYCYSFKYDKQNKLKERIERVYKS